MDLLFQGEAETDLVVDPSMLGVADTRNPEGGRDLGWVGVVVGCGADVLPKSWAGVDLRTGVQVLLLVGYAPEIVLELRLGVVSGGVARRTA